MGTRKTGLLTVVVVFVVVLCALVTVVLSFGSKTGTGKLVSGVQGDSLKLLHLDEGLEGLLWNHCGKDLNQIKEAIEDHDLCLPGKMYCGVNGIGTKIPSLAKETTQQTLSVQHPKLKQMILDCLISKNFLLSLPGEEIKSNNWNIPYLESILLRPDIARRKLISDALELEGILGTPSPTPSPAPAPAPSSVVESPTLSPAPTPEAAPSGSQSPDRSPIFFPPSTNSTDQPSSDELTSASPSPVSSEQSTTKNSHAKSVGIAVAITFLATFVVVALLFLCYTKVLKHGRRQNDERPLLSLSLSDYSFGSPHKSFRNNPCVSSDSQNRKDSALNGISYSESGTLNTFLSQPLPPAPNGGVTKYSIDTSNSFDAISTQVPQSGLKPPPGRLEVSSSGLLSPMPLTSNSNPNPPPPIPARPAPPAPPLKPAGAPGPPPPRPPPSGPPPPMPPMPPKPPGGNSGPRPPPPPKNGTGPPRPPGPPAPMGGPRPNRPPVGPNPPSSSASADESDPSKAKLKPFFWDKVMANPDESMVWHQIKSGSFQFNEEMIENLFGAAPANNKNENKKDSSSQERPAQAIQLIDQKKAQNLAILLRAMNVTTEEVCDALEEGTELPVEFLQTLLKMAPTQEEELKLRLFAGELSQLGPAERFLKAMVEIPFAFKRIESLYFMSSLLEEVTIIKESFTTLEAACKELRNSRLFLKLLEAVLKTGNRMNNGTFRGGAQAFKLDTLLKLSDVKGTDGKTTLLQFVVQEIIRSEGVRAARGAGAASLSSCSIKSDDFVDESPDDTEEHFRNLGLQVVSGLSSELEHVKKVANLDADSISGTVMKLGQALVKTREFLNSEIKRNNEETGFRQTLKSFVQNAEVDIMWCLEEEKRIMALVKSIGDYFHGNAGKDDGLRLFVIVRDFLIMLDKTCKEISLKKPVKSQKREITSTSSSSSLHPPSSPDLRPRLFPAITDRRADSSSSSSDDDD